MARDRIVFDWTVNGSGYRWAVAVAAGLPGNQPQAVLAAEVERVGDPPSRHPEPDSALFRVFAELKPDKDAVLAFADRYGPLLGDESEMASRAPHMHTGQPAGAELLVTWQEQAGDMQRLVALWDLLQAGDRDRLAAHIQWRKLKTRGVEVLFDSHPKRREGRGPSLGPRKVRHQIAGPELSPELQSAFDASDPAPPAWAYLQQELEVHLHHTTEDVRAGMSWDPRRGRPALSLHAPTLLAGVWLQFADAVANDRVFSRCRTCGKWFEVAPEAARAHRRFCSDACRVKAYRGRQDRARRLYTAGKTFEEIAEELDSHVATVKRWITGSRE